MLDEIYPKSMRAMFTNRESELKQLHFFKNELLTGRQKNVCILAPRRHGKSMLIKEFILKNMKDKNVLLSYVNLEPIVTTPYDFAIKFVGTINYQIFGEKREYLEYLTRDALITKNVPPTLKNHLHMMYTELEKASPNPSHILTLAFSYPYQIAKTLDKKMMLSLDEFQEIIALRKQKGVGNPLSLFREYFSTDNVSYILAGSIVSILESIFSDASSPLFAQAEKMYLKPFTREATAELVDKSLTVKNHAMKSMIYKYSAGHPFYIYHITKRIQMLHELQELKISPELVKTAFIIETLSVEGKIYDLCDYIYGISLSKARYYAPLKSILNILTVEEGLNQSEVARKLRLSQGATKEYLNELVKLGLIAESEKKYYYQDLVLKYWVAYVQKGLELGGFPSKKDLMAFVKELDEKFQKTSSELGKAKEYEFKVKLEEKYVLALKRYVTSDGQIEFDLVGEKEGVVYIFEIKWRNRPVSVKDVLGFAGKVEQSSFAARKKKLFVVSKSGFDTKVFDVAEKYKIICLDRNISKIDDGTKDVNKKSN